MNITYVTVIGSTDFDANIYIDDEFIENTVLYSSVWVIL